MFLSVGISTVDLFISGIDQMPQFGGNEFTVDNLAFCDRPLTVVLGGNGAISSYAWARLGVETALCSAVGQDPMGDTAMGWLTKAGVDTAGLLRSLKAATATTTVITDDALNRVSFHHPGVSNVYAPTDLPDVLLTKADVLLLSSFSLLPRWRPDGFADMASRARKAGVITALDIGPAIGQPVVFDELKTLLPDIDYFICNEHELAVCIGSTPEETAGSMHRILEAGTNCVVTKEGDKGAKILHSGDSIPHNVPAFPVEAQFTVGAGDSFNAGFLYGIDQGWELVQAAQFANATAALVVSGAQGALGAPTLAQVEKMIQESTI